MRTPDALKFHKKIVLKLSSIINEKVVPYGFSRSIKVIMGIDSSREFNCIFDEVFAQM